MIYYMIWMNKGDWSDIKKEKNTERTEREKSYQKVVRRRVRDEKTCLRRRGICGNKGSTQRHGALRMQHRSACSTTRLVTVNPWLLTYQRLPLLILGTAATILIVQPDISEVEH